MRINLRGLTTIFFIIVLLFCQTTAFTQSKEIVGEWIGMAQSSAKETYTLKALFKDSSDIKIGQITCISGSDFYTVTSFNWEYDKNSLKIIEKDVMKISDQSLLPDICFVTYLSNTFTGNTKVIRGSYTGAYRTGEKCDNGTFILAKVNAKQKERLTEIIDNQVDKLKEQDLSAFLGKEGQLLTSSADGIDIQLRDNFVTDGDSLLIVVGQKREIVALDSSYFHLRLKADRKAPLPIMVIALNEGTEPSNTSHLIIRDTDNYVLVDKTMRLQKNDTTHFVIVSK